ncbi:MAG TPA: glycosyltransferase family 4 protein [Ardenticatenaceae bacterium]
MRILHLIQRFWPARGGAESHLGTISRHLTNMGHEVTVATTDALDFELFWEPRRRRVPEHRSEESGLTIRRFRVRHLPASTLAYPAVRRLLWLLSAARPIPEAAMHPLARLTPWTPDLWQWLETTDEPFDLVAGMTICFEPILEAGLRFAQRRDIPFVIYPLVHLGAGAEPGDDPLSRFYTMRHQNALVRASSAIVAQTPAEKSYYAARGVPEERIHVVGPGVDAEAVLGGDGPRFRERHVISGPIVLSLSSTSYDKGTVHTVEAVRALWRAGRQVELVLAGAVLEPFRRYLGTLPAEERQRIHLLGTIEEQEKRDLLAACDMLVMPSRTDSFGIVYLEAWLYRKPVVGARTWGVMDVIEDGQDGLLVPFADVEALSGAIAHLLDNPDEAAAMGARGEAKVYQHHLWSAKLARIEQLYTELVQEHARAHP